MNFFYTYDLTAKLIWQRRLLDIYSAVALYAGLPVQIVSLLAYWCILIRNFTLLTGNMLGRVSRETGKPLRAPFIIAEWHPKWPPSYFQPSRWVAASCPSELLLMLLQYCCSSYKHQWCGRANTP